MSALNNSALIGASGSTGYQISRSVRLRSSASAYFNRTPASAGNRKTWTWSGWVKRGTLGTVYPPLLMGGTTLSDTGVNAIQFQADALGFIGYNTNFLITTQVFRDPSAWYHLVVAFDSTQATATNRIKMYVNGSQITSFSTDNRASITQNGDYAINQAALHTIGYQSAAFGSNYLDGYLTEINFIDGQALTPSSFGETNPVTGVWQPKKYTGTYGTNGFYLNFSDNSGVTATTIGKDYSGNGNNWTPNNISVTAGSTYDSMLDVPTQWADGGNGRGNYAVLNPVSKIPSTGTATISNGNLEYVGTTTAGTSNGFNASFGVSSGKYYWEVSVTNGVGAETRVGILGYTSGNMEGNASAYYFYRNNNGPLTRKYDGTSFTDYSSYYGSFSNGDIWMFAFDADAGKLWYGKNGSWYNNASGAKDPATGTNPDSSGIPAGIWYPSCSGYTTSASGIANFGQRPFSYTPPSGFKALNTLNLPTPTILKGNQYFDATLYTGNGGTQSIVNSGGFQPDLVWIKSRSTADNHQLQDAVRGATKRLFSNLTDAESVSATSLTSFNSNGFTVGADANYNGSGYSLVGWQWKAGAGSSSSNNSGSITSSVSANTTSGFSVVTYTGNGTAGATIGHGLGVAPSMMIAKNRSSGGSASYEWTVYHASLGATKAVFLNDTGAAATDAGYWYNTAPTSTLITVPSNSRTNVNGSNFVIYCFAEVPGFSKFGSYTGNGSADGPMVFTGFLPRWVMFKKSSATSNWSIIDTARDTFNVADNPLLPNTSGAETTSTSTSGAFLDVLSNGFKLRGNSGDINDSGATYIFAAFASNPFKYSLAF